MAELGRFDWQDPFALDAQLSHEERMVRDVAHGYARGKLLPRVTRAFLDEDFAREIMTEMGALGLLGMTLGFAWQHWLMRERERLACLQAFLSNHWAGMLVFIGLALDYALR